MWPLRLIRCWTSRINQWTIMSLSCPVKSAVTDDDDHRHLQRNSPNKMMTTDIYRGTLHTKWWSQTSTEALSTQNDDDRHLQRHSPHKMMIRHLQRHSPNKMMITDIYRGTLKTKWGSQTSTGTLHTKWGSQTSTEELSTQNYDHRHLQKNSSWRSREELSKQIYNN